MPHQHSLVSLAVVGGALAASAQLDARQAAAVPQYVIDNAPLVKITSGDPYNPSDISAQLSNTHPQLNSTDLPSSSYPNPLTLDNLDALNTVADADNGAFIYLASNGDFTANPQPGYLFGVAPDASGATPNAVSSAIIVNDHQNGTVDAFYMYFYAYNRGNKVLVTPFLGNHVGDWEHNMIRFVNGAPTAIWYSQHSNGEAFEWSASGLQFNGARPITYSANGTHANYATAGTHAYAIPNVPLPDGPLEDTTDDDGFLYDPTLSAYYYTVSFPSGTTPGDSSSPTFSAANNGASAGVAPTAWLNYAGQWGDNQLPSDDPRQTSVFGEAEYTGGPTGPRDKQLNRVDVCPDNGNKCIVRSDVTPGE